VELQRLSIPAAGVAPETSAEEHADRRLSGVV